jgi:hypothetical protein
MWSAWAWVYTTASTRSTRRARHCTRSSGVVSTSTRVSPREMTTLVRVRVSHGSVPVQTAQWQPIIGTPVLVPVPRKSSSTAAAGVASVACKDDIGGRL